MSQIHLCKDNSELSPLYPSRGLHLKPIARLNVSVHYPELKQSLTTGGKSISSWDIMERIKGLVSPEIFIFLRVVKNTLEFIRFEGDLESREILKKIISRLDGKTMKVTGFKEALKIRCAESKLAFPTKYDWDSYFRDAKNMNEMKAGERPDTIHFQNLPCKWFSEDGNRSSSSITKTTTTSAAAAATKDDKPMPSEKLFKRIWAGFGEVKCIDIPSCDPYRSQISTGVRGISTFTFSNDNVFEAYVQYKDYMSFVKAMDALRGCSLFYQESPVGKFYVANIKVEFDKSKHLSDESIKKRRMERDRLADKDKVKKTAEKLSKFEAEVKEQKLQEKEKKETEKNLAKIEYKIAMEERKYLIARRKLEAIRLMDYLFETVKQNIVDTAEKKRVLKENTKKEMKRLQKLVIERNAHDKEEMMMEEKEDQPSKVRKLQSSVKVISNSKEQPRHTKSFDSEEVTDKPKDLKPDDDVESNRKPPPSHNHHYDSRYVGDWEVKARSYGGSEVKVSSNYVPVSSTYRGRGPGGRGGYFRGRGAGPYPPHGSGPPPPPHPNYYHDRYEFDNRPPPHHYNSRGPHHNQPPPYRGRGPRDYDHPYHHQEEQHQQRNLPPPPASHNRGDEEHFQNGPTVRHDFSYLDELDRAYEKYFSSITKRNNDE